MLRRDGVFCHWSAHDRPVAERPRVSASDVNRRVASATLLGQVINERSTSHETARDAWNMQASDGADPKSVPAGCTNSMHALASCIHLQPCLQHQKQQVQAWRDGPGASRDGDSDWTIHSAVGCWVTLQSGILRRWCWMTKKPYSTRNVTVGTVKPREFEGYPPQSGFSWARRPLPSLSSWVILGLPPRGHHRQRQ